MWIDTRMYFFVLILIVFTRSTWSVDEVKCGMANKDSEDLRTSAPWSAAVFVRSSDNSGYKYLVSGTIVGPSTILTIFGKGFGDSLSNGGHYRIPSPTNVLVITGIRSTSFEDWDDKTQLSQISYISPYRDQTDAYKDFHLVLMHLRTPLNLETHHVQPICLNHHKANSRLESQTFNLAGFRKIPSTNSTDSSNMLLQVEEIKVGGKSNCEALFSKFYQGSPNYVFCGTPINQNKDITSTCNLSHGSALVTQVEDELYLKGISALIPQRKNANCQFNSTYIFADTSKIIAWIKQNQECGPTKFFCSTGCIPLRKVCNVEEDCEDFEDENPIFCKASSRCPTGTFQCGLYGICLPKNKLCNGIPECSDGSDELFNVCRAYRQVENNSSVELCNASTQTVVAPRFKNTRTCAKLRVSEGVVSSCFELSHNETKTIVDCHDAKIGTQATLSCGSHYHSISRIPLLKMTCAADGNWIPFRSFACAPNCGDLRSAFKFNVANGAKTSAEISFPWYSAIFAWNGTDYAFICGASLVESGAVLTAAHCVTKDNGEIKNVESFRIVLSPISSDFNKNLEDRFTQIVEVMATFVHSSYNSKFLQSDIAVVILKTRVIFGDFIQPVCYLSSTFSEVPVAGTFGKISGLGIDETNKISKVLKYANFPVVTNDECNLSLDGVVPLNTFCAGYKNGTSVCKGDSGGGLVFEDPKEAKGRYFLKGIVSHSDLGNRLCDLENFAVFTHVDSFSKWILEILSKFQ